MKPGIALTPISNNKTNQQWNALFSSQARQLTRILKWIHIGFILTGLGSAPFFFGSKAIFPQSLKPFLGLAILSVLLLCGLFLLRRWNKSKITSSGNFYKWGIPKELTNSQQEQIFLLMRWSVICLASWCLALFVAFSALGLLWFTNVVLFPWLLYSLSLLSIIGNKPRTGVSFKCNPKPA